MNLNTTSSPTEPNLLEFIEMGRQFSVIPTSTVLPLMRPRLGLRMCEGWYYTGSVLALAVFGDMRHDVPLMAFAGLSWVAAKAQSWLRDREMKSGIEWHTYSVGVSPFEYLNAYLKPPPRFAGIIQAVTDNERLYRFADPLLVIGAGAVCYEALPASALGTWLVISGLSLRVFEEYVYGRQRKQRLDAYDNAIAAGMMGSTLQQLQEGQAPPRQHKDPASKGLPTGPTDDLRPQVAKRRAETAARAEAAKQASLAELREAAERMKAETAARAEELEKAAQAARERVEEAQAAMDQRLKEEAGQSPVSSPPLVIIREERETIIETQQIMQPVIVAIEQPAPATLIIAAPEPPALNGHTPDALPEPRERLALPAPKDET